MPQVRGQFPELYDNVEKTLRNLIRDALQELDPIWKEVYNVKTSTLKFERSVTVVPFGNPVEKPEGEPYALDVMKAGYTKDFTHLEFGLGFEVTETALEDDQYDQLARQGEMLAFSCRYLQEKRAADIFNNGFTTETTPDGVSLFNSAHVLKGGGTAKNRPATDSDMSPTSLMQALIDLQTDTKDEAGHLVAPVKSFIVYVPPGVEFVASRIIDSAGMAGTSDNDINPLKRRTFRIVVNPHLSDVDAWFLVAANKKFHGITSYVRLPITQAPRMFDPFTNNMIFKVRFRQSWGAWMWQGTYGTSGA